MKKVLVCALVATSLILSSCGILDIGDRSVENGSVEAVILLGEDEEVGSLSADRASISDVKLRGPELTLEVTYSGGCKEHELSLYATRSFVETNPPGAEVYLAHDANGDACRALITDELTFDLLPLEQLFQKQYSSDGAFLVNLHEPTGDEPRFEHIEQESPLYEVI